MDAGRWKLAAAATAAAVSLALAVLQTARHRGAARLARRYDRERFVERTGRVRAERALRKLQLQQVGAAAEPGAAGVDSAADGGQPLRREAFPLPCLGRVRSCFTNRSGTPRQPLLVPAATCRLELAPWVPAAALEGLEEYSHAWVLYVFHANTDLGEVLSPQSNSTCKAKISVPRLQGARRGVLSTRAPHRPCPVGLSLCRIGQIRGRTLTLHSADLVDGTPVLDVKPYLPGWDRVEEAAAPHWVIGECPSEEEPLRIDEVLVPAAAWEALAAQWALGRRGRVMRDADAFLELVTQVLSADIRSRRDIKRAADHCTDGSGMFENGTPWRVVLDGVTVTYAVHERSGPSPASVEVLGCEDGGAGDA